MILQINDLRLQLDPQFPKLEQTPSNWHQPKETRAGTADWLIQKDTQDMATSKMEGM